MPEDDQPRLIVEAGRHDRVLPAAPVDVGCRSRARRGRPARAPRALWSFPSSKAVASGRGKTAGTGRPARTRIRAQRGKRSRPWCSKIDVVTDRRLSQSSPETDPGLPVVPSTRALSPITGRVTWQGSGRAPGRNRGGWPARSSARSCCRKLHQPARRRRPPRARQSTGSTATRPRRCPRSTPPPARARTGSTPPSSDSTRASLQRPQPCLRPCRPWTRAGRRRCAG